MRSRNHSALLLAAPLLLGLSACEAGSGASTPSGSATGESEESESESEDRSGQQSLAVAETGWLSVGRDGSVQTTFFDTGGRYRDYRNGEPSGQGSWTQLPGGSICFVPETGLGACWETGTPGEDGSVIVTNQDDKRVEIKRITYTAPESDEGNAADESR